MMRIADWMMNLLRWPWLWFRSIIPMIFRKIPGAIFEFDDGTDEGFAVTAVYDDAGQPYGAFTVAHFEAAQYPNQYPGGNPLNDKVGSLSIDGAQWGPWATYYNFPKTSKYWQFDTVSPLLTASQPWQKVQAVEAWVADGYSTTGEHLSAAILLYVEQNGIRTMHPEVGGSVFHKVKHNAWSKVSATFKVPQGATVRNVVVRIRGEWADSSLGAGKYPLYEGAIGIDHVAAA